MHIAVYKLPDIAIIYSLPKFKEGWNYKRIFPLDTSFIPQPHPVSVCVVRVHMHTHSSHLDCSWMVGHDLFTGLQYGLCFFQSIWQYYTVSDPASIMVDLFLWFGPSNWENFLTKKLFWGTCLAVQWLRLCTPNAEGWGSIPD